MQVDAPVTQEVMPLRQTDGLVAHVIPAVHDTHVPVPLQTWFVPQVVPAAVLPESRQRGAPVVQSVMPVLQGEPGFVVHASPAMHITHCPLPLHTMPEPQAAPAPTFPPSTQPGDVPQATTPSLHIPPGLLAQTVPAAQAVHAPVLQTLSMPHEMPSVASMSSRHCGAPVAHAIAPFLQGLPMLLVQFAPSAQGMQVPAALQTCPVPQFPPGLLAAPFMQPAGLQTVTPLVHGSLLVAQAMPGLQTLQVPLTHSLLLPHGVPSRAF
jgi:hypothetical protein